jgi:septum formation protein
MLLSGRKHHVYTAVVLRGPDGRLRERLSETSVTFARLSPDQQDRYIDSGEWHGKAGGYAVQGIAASFVRTLSGSYSGVVGLPLFETAQLLRSHGWRIP